MEYLAAKVLQPLKTRIIPRHMQLSIRNNEELNELLSAVTIAQVGVLSEIEALSLPTDRYDTVT